MVLAAFVYYFNIKMTSVVEITFVDESLNFDFEKSGKHWPRDYGNEI